jgi:hypothetical protein
MHPNWEVSELESVPMNLVTRHSPPMARAFLTSSDTWTDETDRVPAHAMMNTPV